MRNIEDALQRVKDVYFPLKIKGKVYNGNDAYVLNMMNVQLEAGKILKNFGKLKYDIEPLYKEDIEEYDEKFLEWDETEYYFFATPLHDISFEMNKISNDLSFENNEYCAERDRNENKN